MAEYDFSTLNSSDLEELVCDLLNARAKSEKLTERFKTFKDGKDKGIDFLYSSDKIQYEIVGQVKHYYRSGYELLYQTLKNDEKDKVKKLNPSKYIIATSVDLSVAQTENIRILLKPFIKKLSDIYGKKDLNRLLNSYPDVLENHFKLWYAGSAILHKIIHYEIEGRSHEFAELQLKKRLRLYVKTSALQNAQKILNKNNFIILTGEPGVGKTTTAELLLYEYIGRDYELIYIYDDIKEVESKLTRDDKKQVFYYDDFLGHNSLEISKAQGSETALLKILNRISNTKNKKMIFTTRNFILNTAVEKSEKLRRFNLKPNESMVELSAYSTEIKEQILSNHAEEYITSADLKSVLNDYEIRKFIIRHNNFSPRSVEFITSPHNISNFSPEDYKKFIIKNFNAPDEIWRHAYEQQINDIDRFLLNTMLSFGGYAHILQLETAFNARIDYEVKNNHYTRPMNGFRNSFKRLENGFIVLIANSDGVYNFINHSLTDFLVNHLRKNRDEVIRISESAFFLKQLITRLYPLSSYIDYDTKPFISDTLKHKLLWNNQDYIRPGSENEDMLNLVMLLYKHIALSESEAVILNLLNKITDWSFIENDHDIGFNLMDFMKTLESTVLKEKISEQGHRVFRPLIYVEDDLDAILSHIDFFIKKFDGKPKNLLINDNIYNFKDKFSALLNERIEMEIEYLFSLSNAQDFIYEKEKECSDIKDRLADMGAYTRVNLSDFSAHNWDEIGRDNYFWEQLDKDD